MKKLTLPDALIILPPFKHTELHIHHTYHPHHADFNGDNHIELNENMRSFHINTRKYRDIAQHLTLFPDGVFVTGRRFDWRPASITNYNGQDGIGTCPLMVEMLGNFNEGNDKLMGEQLNAIIGLAKFFHKENKYIRFHRENMATDCPGTGLYKERFMELVTKQEFPDVIGHYAEASIRRVLASGKMSGYGDGTFRPNDFLTRAEIAMLIDRGSI